MKYSEMHAMSGGSGDDDTENEPVNGKAVDFRTVETALATYSAGIQALLQKAWLTNIEPVFVYLRTTRPVRSTYLRAMYRVFSKYCAEHGWRIAKVFLDSGVAHQEQYRLGFADLCVALDKKPGTTVVILHLRHLSEDELVLRRMTNRLKATHTTLRVIRGGHEVHHQGGQAPSVGE